MNKVFTFLGAKPVAEELDFSLELWTAAFHEGNAFGGTLPKLPRLTPTERLRLKDFLADDMMEFRRRSGFTPPKTWSL